MDLRRMQFKICNEKLHNSYTSLGVVTLICCWVTHDAFKWMGYVTPIAGWLVWMKSNWKELEKCGYHLQCPHICWEGLRKTVQTSNSEPITITCSRGGNYSTVTWDDTVVKPTVVGSVWLVYHLECWKDNIKGGPKVNGLSGRQAEKFAWPWRWRHFDAYKNCPVTQNRHHRFAS